MSVSSKRKYSIIALVVIAVSILIFYFNNALKFDQAAQPCTISPYMVHGRQADSTGEEQLVIVPKLLWKNRKVLNVYFLDVDSLIAKRTLAIANKWLEKSEMSFVKVDNSTASDIRVAFRSGGGYRSLIGTQSEELKHIGLPTLWLDNLHKAPKQIFERTVLHEFGHVLGVLHEFKNPNSKIQWKEVETIAYFLSKNLTKAQIRASILNPPPYKIESSDYDPKSIMIYQIPSRLLKTGEPTYWPKGLSITDKTKIKDYYP